MIGGCAILEGSLKKNCRGEKQWLEEGKTSLLGKKKKGSISAPENESRDLLKWIKATADGRQRDELRGKGTPSTTSLAVQSGEKKKEKLRPRKKSADGRCGLQVI